MKRSLQDDQSTEAGLRWPKPYLRLTPEEEAVREQVNLEFQEWGYTGLIGWAQTQGHLVCERLSRGDSGQTKQALRSLEVGCGSGYHFGYVREGAYVGLDVSVKHLRRAKQKYPGFSLVHGDAYDLPFRPDIFDRVVSVYSFEHLNRLPETLAEVRRVLKSGGELMVALPAEGGLAYDWGRRLTSKRHFESKYGVDYLRLVRSEHCNTCQEVIEELRNWFRVEVVRYLPLLVPTVHLNAVVVVRCVNYPPKNTR